MTRDRVARLGHRALDPDSVNVFLRIRVSQELAALFFPLSKGASGRTRRVPQVDECERSQLERYMRLSANGQGPLLVRDPTWMRPNSARCCSRALVWRCPLDRLIALFEDYAKKPMTTTRHAEAPMEGNLRARRIRCMAPAARSLPHRDHHIEYRSHQGSDELWNQLCLCRAHHAHGEHGEFARFRGRAPLDVSIRLGREELATWYRNERRIPPPESVHQGRCRSAIAA